MDILVIVIIILVIGIIATLYYKHSTAVEGFVSSNTYFDNWKRGGYPIYPVGSYDQKTHNDKDFYKNVDNGECTPADICYQSADFVPKSSPILKPTNPSNASESRVNYYVTPYNLTAGVAVVQPTVF